LVILGVDYFHLIIVSIYLGAIAVLFLFVIMMLKIKTKDVNYKIMPFLLASVLSIFIIELGCLSNQLQFFDSLVIYKIFIYNNFLDSSIVYSDWFLLFNYLSSVRSIGISLYTQFFFYIFLFSIIFLVSMLGSILLAMNWFNKGKKQNYFSQISKSNFIEI
jgi:NADH:ubiquinone oxidoreductase subunit 6 (subunit J)